MNYPIIYVIIVYYNKIIIIIDTYKIIIIFFYYLREDGYNFIASKLRTIARAMASFRRMKLLF